MRWSGLISSSIERNENSNRQCLIFIFHLSYLLKKHLLHNEYWHVYESRPTVAASLRKLRKTEDHIAMPSDTRSPSLKVLDPSIPYISLSLSSYHLICLIPMYVTKKRRNPHLSLSQHPSPSPSSTPPCPCISAATALVVSLDTVGAMLRPTCVVVWCKWGSRER